MPCGKKKDKKILKVKGFRISQGNLVKGIGQVNKSNGPHYEHGPFIH